MLDPNSRQIYLDELRPPVGYMLDRAIATTFSLDLMTLLMAPLSMALNDCRDRQTAMKDPIAVMEALKQTADKFLVFCQEGRIQVPAKDQVLYRHLEPIVVQMRPPSQEGVFHAKTWLMRFVSEESNEPVRYRLLCLSRNLTFDRSWDTILTLDGELVDRERPFRDNQPLVDFYASLPLLATAAPPKPWADAMTLILRELQRVRFDAPEGFEGSIRFWPIGIAGQKRHPNIKARSRVLIVSPFLSDEVVRDLAESGKDNVLVSRLESLDALSAKTVKTLRKNAELFVLEDGADASEETAEDASPEEPREPITIGDARFSGLHAKLYILEDGADVIVLTGSANATSAGLKGQNVELLVELQGRRNKAGIDAFLGGDSDQTSFRSLLRPYPGQGATDDTPSVERQLEQALEAARRLLARAGARVIVWPADQGLFSLQVLLKDPVQLPEGVCGACYPISLQPSAGLDLRPLANGSGLTFPAVSLLALTGFLAVELTAQKAGVKQTASFVLNLPVEGLPPDRDKRIIHDIINDPGKFIRYLMLILCGEELLSGNGTPGGREQRGSSGKGRDSGVMLPLLEEMIRALSRQPEKIDRIARLVEDILQDPDGRSLLPKDFISIWDVVLAARKEGVQA